jgi:NhaA family Na+:H+ antiporter
MNDTEQVPLRLPKPLVDRWLAPVNRFLHIESSCGLVLLSAAAIALIAANSPWAESFLAIWKTPVEFVFGPIELRGDLGHLVINDGLMTIFFFVIGLEIKREIVAGELADPRKALLPIIAAAGGAIVPASVYLASQWGEPGQRGWAIPMATDIAFVVGFLALFGKRVPFSLKIFLLSLAIVDDLIAVLLIALVYTNKLAWGWIGVAAVGFAITTMLNLIGVRRVGMYVALGAVIWLAVYKSGVHPTVAGVLLGLLTPASAWVGDKTFVAVVGELWDRLRGQEKGDDRLVDLEMLQFAAREAISPLARLEHALHPWVAFVIMPLFALANAGVPVNLQAVTEPVAVAVASGLVIGKPLGIVLFTWVAVALGLSSLPKGVNWLQLIGGAWLAGIGFTMALFITSLAFPTAEYPTREAAGKIGTLIGSAISAFLGGGLLLYALRSKKAATPETEPVNV